MQTHVITRWRKSSYSNPNGECVKVGQAAPGMIAVGDTKDSKPMLVVTPDAWRVFTAEIKEGQHEAAIRA